MTRIPSPCDGICPACFEPITEGEPVAGIQFGPGNDPEQRFRARRGWVYEPTGAAVHWACATGEEDDEFGPLELTEPPCEVTRSS